MHPADLYVPADKSVLYPDGPVSSGICSRQSLAVKEVKRPKGDSLGDLYVPAGGSIGNRDPWR